MGPNDLIGREVEILLKSLSEQYARQAREAADAVELPATSIVSAVAAKT